MKKVVSSKEVTFTHKVIKQLVDFELNKQTTFDVKNKNIVIDDNEITIDIQLVWDVDNQNLKANLDLLEEDLFQRIIFFTSISPNITIGIEI